MGGMVVHKNGHLYCIHSNRLIKFQDGDISKAIQRNIPHSLNHGLVLTNGMVVTQDGYLVVKQFSFNVADLPFIILSKTKTIKILVAIAFCVCPLCWFIMFSGRKDKPSMAQKLGRISISVLIGGLVSLCLWVIVLMYGMKQQIGYFSPVRFILDGLFSNNFGGGEVKIIDPDTLQVVASASLPERVSWSRVGVTKCDGPHGESEDAIILMGDEHVFQLRWRPAEKKLYWVRDCVAIYVCVGM